MKKGLLLLFCSPLFLMAQQTYVPDDNFEQALINLGYDIVLDDSVTTLSIDTVTYLGVSVLNISDLTGIEDFTNLTYLGCNDNQLTSLDISQNTALTELKCHGNQLTSLDVSQNTALTELKCHGNQLTSLDISNNIALTYLGCNNNQLTTLDVNNNTALSQLFCYSNQISNLDVSNNTSLTRFYCYDNQLTSLDVRNGNNQNFINFYSAINPSLSCINVDNAAWSTIWWTSIDPQHYFSTNCIALQTFVPDDNFEAYLESNGMGNGIANDDSVTTASIDTVTDLYVASLNITDLTGIEDFTALTSLECDDNQITSLDVSYNTALNSFGCSYNQLTILDVSQNTALNSFGFSNNQLTSLDVSNNHNLVYLYCSGNQLTSIDITSNIALVDLRLDYNQLTSLDLSSNINLTHLDFFESQLTSIDLSQNTDLIELRCGINLLTSLDLSKNTSLEHLYCQSNQLTSLDVSYNTALTTLFCFGNQLTNLDVRNGNNTNFTDFNSTYNPNLSCINVDVAAWSTTNWLDIDFQHYFSTNCSPSVIQEHSKNKEFLKVTDLLGRETKGTENELLFYIYSDGTVEKRIVVE